MWTSGRKTYKSHTETAKEIPQVTIADSQTNIAVIFLNLAKGERGLCTDQLPTMLQLLWEMGGILWLSMTKANTFHVLLDLSLTMITLLR